MRHSQLSKWLVATGNYVVSASTTIEGVRLENSKLYAGDITPSLWLQDVPSGKLSLLVDDDQLNLFNAYEPDRDEYRIIYTLYPATRPKTDITPNMPNKTRWYKVTDVMPYGVTALCDIEGVCEAGETAFSGQVIPSQWLAGLTDEQINRLRQSPLTSQSFVDSLPPERRALMRNAPLRPAIVEYKPDPLELDTLYEQYPGAHPDYIAPIAQTNDSEE